MIFDGPIEPTQSRHVLKFLAGKLSPEDFAQVEALVRTDEGGTTQPKPTAQKPIVPMSHGGDPAAPGYGEGKDYAGMRAQEERARAALNRRPAKDGLLGGVLGEAAGGVAGGPLGALAGGVIGASIDDDKIASSVGQDQRIATDARRNPTSFDAMFPDAARIAMDSYSRYAAPPRQASMSRQAMSSYNSMFPDAKKIRRI